jgi:hypothetical protein
VKPTKRSAKHGLVALSERSNRERRLQPTVRVRRPFAPEPAAPRLPMIAEWNARLPPVAGRASLARLPFTPALLAKAHLFGKVRTRLGVIWRDHRIIGREAPFLAVFVR